jgi:hypothetical protein
MDTPGGIAFESESFYAKSPAVTRLEQLSGFDVRNRSGVRFVREIELHPTDYIILNAEARAVLRIQAFKGKRAYDIFPQDVHQYISVQGMERPAAPVMKRVTNPVVSVIANDKAPNVLATSDEGVKHPWSSALALVENEPGSAPAFCKWAVQRGIEAGEYITDDIVLTYIALPPEEKLALLR